MREIILFIYSAFAFLANLYNKVKFLCCQPRCFIYTFTLLFIFLMLAYYYHYSNTYCNYLKP